MKRRFWIAPYRCSDVITLSCLFTCFGLISYTLLSKDLEIEGTYGGAGNELPPSNDSTSGLSSSKNDFLQILLQDDENNPLKVAPPLNNTGLGRDSLVFLTCIPRSGQSLLREVMRRLKVTNGFSVAAAGDAPTARRKKGVTLTDEEQRNVIRNSAAFQNATVAANQFAFIDFAKTGGAPPPIHVSLVRDPLDRAISLYYFARAPYNVVERYNGGRDAALPSRKYLKKSLESCLSDPTDAECNLEKGTEREGHTVQYFCGHDPVCSLFESEEGLKMAEANVEKWFSVVGVAEEAEKTLVVMEYYVPRFFKGALQVYYDLERTSPQPLRNKNIYRPSVERTEMRKMNEKMKMERRFYDFLRRRLNNQYDKIVERTKIYEHLRTKKV